MRRIMDAVAAAAASTLLCLAGQDKKPNPLDEYIREASGRAQQGPASPGSLYTPAGRYGDVARDLRAAQVDDIVTIVVADKASAVARGTTSSQRQSSVKAGVSAFAGPIAPTAPWAQMAGADSKQQLDGEGETSRSSSLSTTVSARVVHVLPNGNLVVEGNKEVSVNSEKQLVSIRGIVRWNDLSPANRISSDRLANLEVRVQGKGVVDDAIRRPNFLYRLLLGILPF